MARSGEREFAVCVAGLIAAILLLLVLCARFSLEAQAEEAEIAVLNARIAELEARPLTIELTREDPEDKPEWHVEATEPSYFDSNDLDWDYDYVVRVVGAEARGEPVEGIMAVAQCILDTAIHDGITPEQVVKRPGQYATPLPQGYEGGELVNECCLRVFACGERVAEDEIEFFCTVGCNSAWHHSQRYVTTIGGHEFYARW